MQRAGKALVAVADPKLFSGGAQLVLAPVVLGELTRVFETLKRAFRALSDRFAAQQRDAREQQRPDNREKARAALKPRDTQHRDRRHLAEGQKKRSKELERAAVVAADHVSEQFDIGIFAYPIGHIHQKNLQNESYHTVLICGISIKNRQMEK